MHFKARFALWGLLVLACPGTASAQDKLNHPSLEMTIARAKAVYVGHVISASNNGGLTFTVAVDEVVKGPLKGTVGESNVIFQPKDNYPLAGGDPEIKRRLKSKEQFLWFIDSENPAHWSSMPLTRPNPPREPDRPLLHASESLFDAGYGYPMFSDDLSVLTTKREILEHARRFVKRHPGPVEGYELYVSGPVAERSGWTFGINHILVPKTEELENTARRLVENPDFALPKTWRTPTFFFDIAYGRTTEGMAAQMRESGIRALALFKSDANIQLLRRCLGDPGVDLAAWSEYPATRSFIVRDAAYKVLTDWGVPVPKPG